MKEKLYHILDFGEIITRLIAVTSPLDGPSCFPVIIRYEAGNRTQPPIISVGLYETQSDGSDRSLFSAEFDQNTSYDRFEIEMKNLMTTVQDCCEAISKGWSYQQLIDSRKQIIKSKESEDDNLPF